MSRVVRPGRRFNLVGLRWRGGQIASLGFRVRRDGGGWSRWVAVGDRHRPRARPRHARGSGARAASRIPLWAGDADEVQTGAQPRAARVRDLRLRFVNTKGTATPLERLRSSCAHASRAR